MTFIIDINLELDKQYDRLQDIVDNGNKTEFFLGFETETMLKACVRELQSKYPKHQFYHNEKGDKIIFDVIE